ncbi:CNNM domain-containing protein [Ferrimonas marina]|uniref:Hemolysin, contains CBS domains n=1 Tax=Ferrimonas marina TaxID=299255 RepID=A0A1M5S4I3_9GAMM|nr:CNNM domain-containing protein [Ferrimonas marina]SHH33355.1 Hemolysin, contains CBS domains [Ferrimonas marina]
MLLLSVYIALAIGVSFICSVLEATLLSITPAYIKGLKADHPKAADRLEKLKANIEAPLVAILTLNTVAHTAGAAGAGAQAAAVFGSQVLGLFSAILTLAILFLSEIIPKTLGANYWRQLAPLSARPLQALVTLTKPLIWLSAKMTSLLGKEGSGQYIRSEMSAMADIGAESGELNDQESNILKQMLKARSIPVSAIMTPRTVIFALPQSLTLAEYAHEHSRKGFSRIPIYAHDPDDIVGYVQKADVLMAEKAQPEAPLRTLRRSMTVIPENTQLMRVFELLLNKQNPMAMVVDEYGSVRGLVTMEDVLESLLGLEIVERDDPAEDMQQLAKKLWDHRQKQRKFRVSHDEEPDNKAE